LFYVNCFWRLGSENVLSVCAAWSALKVSVEALTQVEELKKLGKNEYYRCPFPHVHPRHKQAFFKDFDAHFRIFGDREDHLAVAQLHEQLAWEARRAASEKRSLSEEDLRNISLAAWLDAVEQHTGKSIQVVSKK
jgi:hypothetical protein